MIEEEKNIKQKEGEIKEDQKNKEETEIFETENLSELIKKLFINHSIFKTKINALKNIRGREGLIKLYEARKIGDLIVTLSEIIIFYIRNNYNINEEKKEFFSKIYKSVNNLPSMMYSDDCGWNPNSCIKVIKDVDEFLSFLQENKYIIKEEHINLKKIIKIEIENIKKEKEEREENTKITSEDIFQEYFENCIRKTKDEINNDCEEIISQIKEDLDDERKKKIIEIIKNKMITHIDNIKNEIIKIYCKKILSLPYVSISQLITPYKSSFLLNEIDLFNKKMIEVINSKIYNAETVQTLFILNNILIKNIKNSDLEEEIKVCEELYNSFEKEEEDYQEKLYKTINIFLKILQTAFKSYETRSIVKIT